VSVQLTELPKSKQLCRQHILRGSHFALSML